MLKAGARSALEAGSGALARRGIQVSIGIGARIGGDSAMLGLRLGGVGAGELAEASFRVGMGTGAVELAAGGIVRTGTAGPARTLLSAGGRDLAATLGRDLLAGAPAAAGRMLGYSLTDQIIQRTCFVAGTRVLMADDGEQAPPPADAPAEAQVGGWGDHVWMRGAGLLLLAAGPLGRYALSRYRRWRLRVLAEREGGGGEPPTVPLRHPSERGRPSRGVGTSAPATERLEGVFSRSAVGAPATAREG